MQRAGTSRHSEGSYKMTVCRRRGFFMELVVIEQHGLMMRQVYVFTSSGGIYELLIGWILLVDLVVVRILKKDFIKGMAMYVDVELF